ncbi:hypothetical protein BJ684DRAFT_10305, partial [Piptocephalis cylindrospora]
MPVRFEEFFWSSENPQDYRPGVTTLNEKMFQGVVECEEIISFLNARIALEEQYATKLTDLASTKLSPNGFARDEGASLRMTFDSIRGECASLGVSHRQLAGNIAEMVLKPLQRFVDDHRKKLRTGRDDVESGLKQHERQLIELDRSYSAYKGKCQQADQAEETALDRPLSLTLDADGALKPAMLGPILFGSFPEMDEFLTGMQSQIPSKDVPSLFGMYKNSVSGEGIVDWLCAARPESCEDERAGEAVGQAMLSQGYIKPIRRISVFRAESGQMFQWKKSENEAAEAAHKRARKEAENSDMNYKDTVRRTENSRMLMEQNLFSHMSLMQQAEIERINTVKASFMSLAVTISNIIPHTQAMCDRMMVYLETLRPEYDIQVLAEQYQTGPFAPKPLLYRNFYHGSFLDQVFGVSLDEQCRIPKRKVPQFICKCLSSVEKGMADHDAAELRSWWVAPLQLAAVHPLRHDVNQGEKITLRQLRRYELSTVIGALRLYLMELPECLCTYDLYYPIKTLYMSKTEEGDQMARIRSLKDLLATIPPINYTTINVLLQHLHGMCEDLDYEDTYMSELAHVLGPLFLRTKAYTKLTLHDRHPQRMIRDLI